MKGILAWQVITDVSKELGIKEWKQGFITSPIISITLGKFWMPGYGSFTSDTQVPEDTFSAATVRSIRHLM
jgi:hypothetical protein